MAAKFKGKHVQHRGMSGKNMSGPVGKVWRVTTRGIWVTMPNGERQQWHPDDCHVISATR